MKGPRFESVLTVPAMAKARALMEEVGMPLHEFGMKMGYSPVTARKAALRLFYQTTDVRLSTLEAVARVLSVHVRDLL
jgi:hypothetical protein